MVTKDKTKMIGLSDEQAEILSKVLPKMEVKYSKKHDTSYVLGTQKTANRLEALFKEHRSKTSSPRKKSAKKKKHYDLISLTEDNATEDDEKDHKNYLLTTGGSVITGVGVFASLADMVKTTIDHIYFGEWTIKATHEFVNHIGYDCVAGSILFGMYLTLSNGADYFKSKIMAKKIAQNLSQIE